MKAFLIVPMFLFCCCEMSEVIAEEICQLEPCEFLMAVGAMEARLKAAERQLASLQPGTEGPLCPVGDACVGNPCPRGSKCDTNPLNGRAVCTCPSGYTGSACNVDINECTVGANPCQQGGRCRNTEGSFQCQCLPGYESPRCMTDLLLSDLDCEEIYNNVSTQRGVYTIYPTTTPAKVYCDMDTDGGKWTVIQRRVDGTVNFYRPWAQYKAGFGDASGEYWLGLENMHLLTKNRTYQLRVDMEDFVGSTVFASYSSFSVGSEADGYRLQVAGFQDGGAGDSLAHSNGMKFSTFDKDQDVSAENCASRYSGAFWYMDCHHANPNGLYLWGQSHFGTGVNWYHWKGHYYSLKAVAMKIRRVP